MSEPMLKVTVCEGKYTVIQEADGHVYALRYGEPWRDVVGDNLILALAQEVETLREQSATQTKLVQDLQGSLKEAQGEKTRAWGLNNSLMTQNAILRGRVEEFQADNMRSPI